MRLCESCMREIRTCSLSGGRRPARRRLRAPPPTRQRGASGIVDRLWREGPNRTESETPVRLETTMHQPSNEQFELWLSARGAAPIAQRSGEVVAARHGIERSGPDDVPLMEQIIGRENLMRALCKRPISSEAARHSIGAHPIWFARHWVLARGRS